MRKLDEYWEPANVPLSYAILNATCDAAREGRRGGGGGGAVHGGVRLVRSLVAAARQAGRFVERRSRALAGRTMRATPRGALSSSV